MLNWVKGGQSFSATLQAFERQGVAHTLAEPTVTAVSGESAKFLAGGTIPILNNVQLQSDLPVRIHPAALRRDAELHPGRPVARSHPIAHRDRSHRRRLRDASHVQRHLDPGFRTRNNTTTVELPSGGSIASAGLISTQTQQAVNGFPALMNVPVLGALFRSRDYQRNETELMIVVTPYIVHAIDPNQSFGRTRTSRTPAIRKPGCSAASTASIRPQNRFNRCRATQERSDSSPTRSRRLRPRIRRTEKDTSDGRSSPQTIRFRARSLSLGFVAAAALSGCGVDYASTAPAFPGDFQERHPIVLASAPTSLDVFAVGGALDTRSIENIRAFAQRYRHYGSGDIAILAPAGTTANSNAVREVRAALARAGVNGGVRFGTYATPDSGAAAPIRLLFIGVKATRADGMRPMARGPRLGIIGRRMEERALLELRLRHPIDDGRPGRRPARSRPAAGAGPSDVEMRTRAIEAVRNGQDPGTQWTDTVLTPIGGHSAAGDSDR